MPRPRAGGHAGAARIITILAIAGTLSACGVYGPPMRTRPDAGPASEPVTESTSEPDSVMTEPITGPTEEEQEVERKRNDGPWATD